MSYVYALLDQGYIVYIGRSKTLYNLKQRLYIHKRNGKVFDGHIRKKVDGYEASKKEENRLIKELLPKYNKQGIIGRVVQNRTYYSPV